MIRSDLSIFFPQELKAPTNDDFLGIPLSKGIGPSRGYPHESRNQRAFASLQDDIGPSSAYDYSPGFGWGVLGETQAFSAFWVPFPPSPKIQMAPFLKQLYTVNRKIVFPSSNFHGIRYVGYVIYVSFGVSNP